MMNMKSKNTGYYYEKFRAFMLVFLMVLCIVQVGILWSSQSGSLPFFSGSKIESQASIEDKKGDYLLPYRVFISTGFMQDHYIIPNGSSEYDTLWGGAKLYLTQALNIKPKQTEPFSEGKWGTLVANKPYTFEFKTEIPIEIIKWILNLKPSAGEGLSSIYKVVICPDDPDNSYSDTLFIRDNKNIYTYEIPNSNEKALGKEEVRSIYTKQQMGTSSKNYEIAIEKYRKAETIKITQDMLAPFSQKRVESYPDVIYSSFGDQDGKEYDISEYNAIARELLGEAKNDYDPDVDVNGSAVFKKSDSVYRLYNNSVLEYRYIGSQGNAEKTKVLEAYKKAMGFIMEHSSQSEKSFMSNITIYLKSITEGTNSYTFDFDYSISLGDEGGEMPILMKNFKMPNSDKQLDSSISIEASAKRVLHCEWIALKFKVDKNLDSYEWSFVDKLAEVFNTYSELEQKELSANDFGIYYVLSYPKTQGHLIAPSFVLYTMDGRYDIPMKGNIK